jgi:hypothetical protein
MADLDTSDDLSPTPAAGPKASYEPPALTPIGNLNDLLAGGGSACDDDIDSGTVGCGLGCGIC